MIPILQDNTNDLDNVIGHLGEDGRVVFIDGKEPTVTEALEIFGNISFMLLLAIHVDGKRKIKQMKITSWTKS